MSELSFDDKVRAHFQNAPIVPAIPGAKEWPNESFLGVQSYDELHQLFRVAREFMPKIPEDTAEHELQHVDAIATIGQARGESIGVTLGIAVVRHPLERPKGLGQLSALAVTAPDKDALSDMEMAAVLGHPDEPSNFDIKELRKQGFETVTDLGRAVLRYNAEHGARLLPLPRSYSSVS